MKKVTCPLCEDAFTSEDGLLSHVEKEHDDQIPKNFSASQYIYYTKTGKVHGSCVMCKQNTTWNETTHKYNRFCKRERCKDAYREMFKKRMIGKYGKTTLLNDPEQQRLMLSHRHISGEYKWTDGTLKTYTGSYELEFLKVLDLLMNFESSDVMTPSPHTYYYEYEGEKKFYIPDIYIPSLNLEIEIKQGGTNPNLHPNMVKIDKAKENLKDKLMASQKDVNYIKIVDKNYDNFLKYLFDEKNKIIESKNVKISDIVREASFDIERLTDNIMINDMEYVAEATGEKLYPVYITLFSNDTSFGKLIRKVTGSNYSHATISLDPSLNNMYSFSDVPYSKSAFRSDGFVRESLWSPMYRKNRFFTVLVTFVDKHGRDEIEKKIEYMKANYMKYKYNTFGLIEYYLKMRNTTNHDEHKKMKWFCSEFVSGMLDAAGVKGFDNVLQSPEDIKSKAGDDVIILRDFTLKTFSEKELIRATKDAEIRFRQIHSVSESVDDINIHIPVLEFSFKDLLPVKKQTYSELKVNEYTSLIDWKKLYDTFTKLFKSSDPAVRFDLFELILRKYIIPFNKSVKDVTDEIIKEIEHIFNVIKTTVIQSVDVIEGKITALVNGVLKTFEYPIG